ncbi:MAG: hypothetical protein AB7L41_15360 [Flavobacteriaceae bacterium]
MPSLSEIMDAVRGFWPLRSPLRRVEKIADSDALFRFVSTRSAFVSQHKLYGYLKTRMGLKFPHMFSDDEFVVSIDIAKLNVFAAALSDMTCFAISEAMPAGAFDDAQRNRVAADCFAAGIAENDDGSCGPEAAAQWRARFQERLARVHWAPAGAKWFVESPKALVRWAPIADELKRHDGEIVEGSIRHAWIEIRRQFLENLDRPALENSLAAYGQSQAAEAR